MLLKNKKFLAAISGGPDSMAMLDLYHNQIAAICHVNYHYRNDSDIDMNIVKKYANKYCIPCYIYEVNKSIYQQKFNFENWARKVRYTFFNDIAHQLNIFDILIAHNSDDSLETALMQKKKHSQSLYLGIKPKSKFLDLVIYRPLIKKTKKELETYCINRKIEYAIDHTNFDPKYTRNKIRLELKDQDQKYLIELKNEINNFNLANKTILLSSQKLFNKWKLSKWNLQYFKSLTKKYQIQLIYQLLTLQNIKRINQNKINEIIKFIYSSKGNISYRINSKTYLYKKNKYLYIKVI